LLLDKRLEFGLNCFHFGTLVACGKPWPPDGRLPVGLTPARVIQTASQAPRRSFNPSSACNPTIGRSPRPCSRQTARAVIVVGQRLHQGASSLQSSSGRARLGAMRRHSPKACRGAPLARKTNDKLTVTLKGHAALWVRRHSKNRFG
jgi:hypothetical protein